MLEGMKEFYQQVQQDAHAQQIDINGRPYTTKGVHAVKEPEPDCLTVTTLTGLVDFLKTNVDKLDVPSLLCHIEGPTSVTLRSALKGEFAQRFIHIRAEADLPEMHFDQYLDGEDFNVWLQSSFVDGEDASGNQKGLVLRYSSNVKQTVEAGAEDDGVTQVVSARVGIASVENVILPNPVTLRPYRTFTEVEQPSSSFIFRAKTGPRFALMEADGGAWRSTAMKNIKAFLEFEVKDLHVIA